MRGAKVWFAILVGCLIGGLVVLGGCGGGGVRRPTIALEATPAPGIQSYPGGIALWVIRVTLTPADAGPVTVTAGSMKGVACQVTPSQLNGSGTVEVLARPDSTVAAQTVNVVVRAELQGGVVALGNGATQLSLPLQVERYRDQLADAAKEKFQPFVTYLAANHPEFGIDENTAPEGWVSAPNILVVMWYSFLSEESEVLVQWHVMIPPYDWTHVYVRARGAPECVWAGEVSTTGAPVTEVALPDVFPRFEAPFIDL